MSGKPEMKSGAPARSTHSRPRLLFPREAKWALTHSRGVAYRRTATTTLSMVWCTPSSTSYRRSTRSARTTSRSAPTTSTTS